MRLIEAVFPMVDDAALRMAGRLRSGLLRRVYGDVLDVGFGTGLNALHYPPAVRRIFALEPSDAMWRRGAKRVASADVDIERLSSYAESIPLEDQVIDVAVCTFVLCCVLFGNRTAYTVS